MSGDDHEAAMTERALARTATLTKQAVDAAKPEAARYTLWDLKLKGFGVRVSPATPRAPHGTKTYVVRYRAGRGRTGPLRQFVIGRHNPLTADQARELAKDALADAQKGGDPQGDRTKLRVDLTVAELCVAYLAEGAGTKKASTLYTDRSRIERHIKPLLGGKKVAAVTQEDVRRFMRDVAEGKTASPMKPTRKAAKAGDGLEGVELRRRSDPVARGGKGAATRTVGLLGGIFAFAIQRGLRSDNPVLGVRRYRDRSVERFLSAKELATLGEAMATYEAAGGDKGGLTALRLLALTGARRGEVEGLKWTEVDLERGALRLADSKTGQKVIPMGAAAVALLASHPKSKSDFVFPSAGDPKKPSTMLPKVWVAVRKSAGLGDVRAHDLRHTFASVGLATGQGLSLLGKLLGHADVKTTARYSHLADDPVKAAADRIAGTIDGAMSGKGGTVTPMRRGA